jgi:hypothetical protein
MPLELVDDASVLVASPASVDVSVTSAVVPDVSGSESDIDVVADVDGDEVGSAVSDAELDIVMDVLVSDDEV